MEKTWQQMGAEHLCKIIDREIMIKILLKPPFYKLRPYKKLFNAGDLNFFKNILN